jgi:AraC-like DNA-binding protein
MLTSFRKLPHRSLGFSFRQQGGPMERCQVGGVGFTLEEDPQKYRFDNRNRSIHCLFQYTLAGEGRFEDLAAGKTVTLTPGQGFLVPFPSPTRYWLPEGRTWEFIYICFRGALSFEHCRNLNRQYGYLYNLPPTSRAVELLFEIYRMALGETGSDPFATSARLYGFLMELYRNRQPVPAQFPEGIRQAKQHIDASAEDANLGIETIAKVSGYSKYHFSRLFRKHVGVSPYAYLLHSRLRRALELVSTTVIPMKQIASITGFQDYPYFCNAFRKHFGRTPATVRREQQAFGISEIQPEGPAVTKRAPRPGSWACT